MAKVASNLSASNVNLLSNKVEGLSEIQQKIREQARISIFETLDLDKRKFTDIALTISSIKDLRDGKKPQKGSLVPDIKYDELQTRDPYKNIFEKYKDADENRKEKMYMEIAERIILEKKGVITYKDGEKIGDDTINENFARAEYDALNKEYDQKLDFFTVKDSDGKLYIIKWSQKELAQIAEKEKQIKDQIIDTIYSQEQEKDTVIAALKKQLANDEGENSTNATVDKPQKNDSEKGGLTEEKINEMIEKKLQTYLEPLHKVQDSNEENNESTENKEENRESVEENPLYVSRHDVELSVAQCRATSDFPTGTIEIKGTSVKVEEFEFYEEMKQEYILAKGDTAKLQQLDREFAELAILCSPKGVAVEQKYQIKLTSQEIAEGGLVVSQTRLAKYGLEVDYFEYTNTIIEREYQERIETIKKIETEINELTTIITELTTKINIEKSSSVEILEIIKQKKARLLILIKRQKELLKTFRKGKKIPKTIDDDKHNDGEVVFKFTDTSGNIFYNECKARKIKRKDGKEIPLKGGINTDVEYVDAEGRILRLERDRGGSYDDGYDNPLADYKFVYTGKKQIFETIYGERRISLGEFDGGEKGELFKHYCDENGIRRKDGKEINPSKFDDDFMDVTYINKDGKELKLEFSRGGAIGGDDNTLNKYEFVYYEGKKERDDDQVGGKLYEIIQEQEALYLELEELERQLMMARTESIRIEIERKITMIQTKLTIINQKITEITNVTKRYKETITQEKYMIIKVRKKTTIFPPMPQHPFEMTAVLSDMGTDVFREKASLKVEEELKAYYKSLGRWQVGSRLALFLGRGRRRKRMIKNEMNNMANTAFQTGAGYGALNEQSQNAADRHKHELDTNMASVNQLATVHNAQVDQLCKNYLNNTINDDQFQQQFNQIIANDANIQNILNGQNITHIGTNVLLRLQEQKALNQLILDMDAQLAQYVATGNVVHMDNMRNYVSQYIKDYQKTPAFMATFEQFVKGDLNARNQLRQYLNHQRAIMQMQITNLRMNIDILNKGKSAYQIDNKDRETGKGSWKYKLGHFMDKHPRGTAIASTAISLGIGLGTGLIASPVVAGRVSLGLFGGLVGTTNAVKKWTHHTKEQNTHEKNVATDYRNEQAKIQAWQNQALNGHGRRKYKAKRQLALYDQTTQENIKLSNQITEYITNLSSKVGPLTADEDNFMRCNLIEGWARLKYYRQMGHNFLASEQVDSTEKDMKRLEKSITLGLQKIGQTTNNIEHGMTATNQLGTNITYDVIQNDLKASYDKSLIQFKRERRNLSLKYGFGTAIASIGIGAFFQWLSGGGIFAKEVPPTPGTPGTPSSTTSHSGGADYFGLGEDNIPGVASFADSGNVYATSKLAISGAPNGSTVTFNYGVGTDATRVVAGHRTPAQLSSKISSVSSNISGMSGLTTAQKGAFLSELSSLSHSGFTNNNGATMRAAEYLEHCAQAMSDCAATAAPSDVARFQSLIPAFNRTFDVSGGTYNKLTERFMRGAIDITTPAIPGTPGTPGIPAKRRGRWFMGFPLFFNTWKDRKATPDTTDQNFGRGNNQQQNRPNNQQPNQQQANPNQPNNP